jgi:serine/threonine protein kinase/tetratricopeptide (TPR) repeat protein
MIGRTLGHYRIVAKIGAGGMGEVYRAHDEQLDRDVAVKVLPSGTIADEGARKQFRKEALALAKLNHPNIETIFEFSSQDDVDFLAMELIAGHSLSETLKEGPLPQSEVLRLGAQLAEGLAAAHDQNIIHRDLKPGNLFVTPDGRLKILDFGLAKFVHPNLSVDATQSLELDQGEISGTVPYMSPEQLRGLPVDSRSDIYAAGAVLYEMATGARPFPQTQGAELMGAILHKTPPSPRSMNPHVSAAFEHVAAQALEKDPSQRYQSARELRVALEALSGGSVPEPKPRMDRKAMSISVLVACIVAVVAILVVGVLLGVNFHGSRDRILVNHASVGGSTEPSSPIKSRRSVAVVGFTNVSGRADEAWLSMALSEMLTTELAAGEQLRTIPGENIAKMKISLPLLDAESYGKDTLQKIRSNLNTDSVVVGSYVAQGNGQIRLDVRLQDSENGETLASFSKKGTESGIDALVSDAGAELREKLGVAAVTDKDAAALRASLPSNSDAARFYSQGLAKLRERDVLAARDLLQKAVAAEPNFALAHAALSGAWQGLGYDSKAASEAKAAYDLSSSLGREDRLSIEGRYREATKDWDKAIDVYRALWQFFPDNLEYGLRLVVAQAEAGKYQDARKTLRELRRLPPPQSDDPRIDLYEATVAVHLAKYQEGLEASSRAIAKARATGARLVLASALIRQAECFRYLADFAKADAAFKESQSIYVAAGDRWGAAMALDGLGSDAYQRGDTRAARAMYEQSLAINREIGSEEYAAGSLANVAMTFYYEGDLVRAREMYQEALLTQRKIGDKYDAANTLNSIGAVLEDEGDLTGAETAYREALDFFRVSGDRSQAAVTMGNLGSALAQQGDLKEARQMYEEALNIKQSVHARHSAAFTEADLGSLLLSQGDLVGARKMLEDSLATRTELGEKTNAERGRLDLASVTLEEGNPAQALSVAQQLADGFHSSNLPDNEASAYDLAARCLLALGKPQAAAAEIQKAEDLSTKSADKVQRLEIATTRGRILTASGDFSGARNKLDGALAAATKAGLVLDEFEARLAIGELKMKSGQSVSGRAYLASLEKDATAKGFLLIARKAKAARGKS